MPINHPHQHLSHRLDLNNLILAQPEATDHKCNFDQLIVTGGSPIPAVCGTNTGQHSKLYFSFMLHPEIHP